MPRRLPTVTRLGVRQVLDLPWPDAYLTRRGGLGTHALVLALLADHADEYGVCWPRIDGMADRLGMNPEAVGRILRDLVDDGMVDRVRLHAPNGAKRSWLYRVRGFPLPPSPDHIAVPQFLTATIPDEWLHQSPQDGGFPPVPESTSASGPESTSASGPRVDAGVGSKGSTQGEVPKKEVTPSSTDVDSDGFDEFWNTWPRRNGKRLHRDRAERAWARIPADQRDAVMVGARHYAAASAAGLAGAMDAFRWLRDRLWTEWQEPAVGADPATNVRYRELLDWWRWDEATMTERAKQRTREAAAALEDLDQRQVRLLRQRWMVAHPDIPGTPWVIADNRHTLAPAAGERAPRCVCGQRGDGHDDGQCVRAGGPGHYQTATP